MAACRFYSTQSHSVSHRISNVIYIRMYKIDALFLLPKLMIQGMLIPIEVPV